MRLQLVCWTLLCVVLDFGSGNIVSVGLGTSWLVWKVWSNRMCDLGLEPVRTRGVFCVFSEDLEWPFNFGSPGFQCCKPIQDGFGALSFWPMRLLLVQESLVLDFQGHVFVSVTWLVILRQRLCKRLLRSHSKWSYVARLIWCSRKCVSDWHIVTIWAEVVLRFDNQIIFPCEKIFRKKLPFTMI